LEELEVKEIRKVVLRRDEDPLTGKVVGEEVVVEPEFTEGRIIAFDPADPRIKDLKPGDKMLLTAKGIKRV